MRLQDSTEVATLVLRFWGSRHLPVLDSEGRVVGMLTPTELMAVAQGSGRARPVSVSEVMRCPVETVGQDEELDLAVARMRQAEAHALAVVDSSGRLVGILTDVDALTSLAGTRPALRPLERTSVDALMTPEPVTVGPDTCLADAAEALLQGGFRHLPVIDDDGRLVGILSERDLRTHLAVDLEGLSHAAVGALADPVSEAMTPEPIAVRTGTPLADVLETFTMERVGSLPVLDETDRLVGMLSYIDILRWLRRNATEAQDATGAQGE